MSEGRKWTVMIYMAADNNLSDQGHLDLIRMKEAGSSDKVAILAQYDPHNTLSTNRYFLKKGGLPHDDVVETLGETNTGNPSTLMEFVQWGITNFPSNHYMVVLWGHSGGALDKDFWFNTDSDENNENNSHNIANGQPMTDLNNFAEKSGFSSDDSAMFNAEVTGVSPDDGSEDFMDNIELKEAFLEITKQLGRKLDIIGVDGCQMGMLEVAYQIQHSADLYIASEALTPRSGWVYEKSLDRLRHKPALTPLELSKLIVTDYLEKTPLDDNPTLSVSALSRPSENSNTQLYDAVDHLAVSMIELLGQNEILEQILDARMNTLNFGDPIEDQDGENYIDLYDFCRRLESITQNASLINCCRAVRQCFSPNGYVVFSGAKGAKSEAKGLTIYFPLQEIEETYTTTHLDFLKDKNWLNFLENLIRVS